MSLLLHPSGVLVQRQKEETTASLSAVLAMYQAMKTAMM